MKKHLSETILAANLLIEWDTPASSTLFITIVDDVLDAHPYSKILNTNSQNPFFLMDNRKIILKYLLNTITNPPINPIQLDLSDTVFPTTFSKNILEWIKEGIGIKYNSLKDNSVKEPSKGEFIKRHFDYNDYLLKLFESLAAIQYEDKKNNEVTELSLYLLISFIFKIPVYLRSRITPQSDPFFIKWSSKVKWKEYNPSRVQVLLKLLLIISFLIFGLPVFIIGSISVSVEELESDEIDPVYIYTSVLVLFIISLAAIFVYHFYTTQLLLYWILCNCIYIIGFVAYINWQDTEKYNSAVEVEKLLLDKNINLKLNKIFREIGTKEPKWLANLLFSDTKPEKISKALPFKIKDYNENLIFLPLYYFTKYINVVDQSFVTYFLELFSNSKQSQIINLTLLNWFLKLEVVSNQEFDASDISPT